MRNEHRELKEWLTSLLPGGMSRNDVADELRVTRKTISTMLNPEKEGFGKGLTMLGYLRLVGVLRDAPAESSATSRLAALEGKVDALATREELQRGLETLRAAIDALANPGTDSGHSAEHGR